MATRIIEYGGSDRGDRLPIVPGRQYVRAQTPLTATGTSQQSAATTTGTSFVIVCSDEQVYVTTGSDPTATTGDIRLAAGDRIEISVNPGDKVAVRT